MSECKLDHSMEDVLAKLDSQKAVLPAALYAETENYVKGGRSQELLNEVFHLLKKYDLASPDEQEARQRRLKMLIENS